MKPTNFNTPGCDPVSSRCVLWEGSDIECINLCKGDSVSDVVFKLATELCDIMDQLDVTNYDLSCLNIQTCAPETFEELIKLLISRICALEGITPEGTTATSGCPNCTVNIASCFYFTDPSTGDQVTTMLLDQYVTLIGNRICDLVTQIASLTESIADLTDRVNALEAANSSRIRNTEVTITPVCVGPQEPTPLSEVTSALERAFCELKTATGETTDLFGGVNAQCNGLASAPSLGTHGGTMSSIIGWINNPNNAGNALTNLWITICDIRSAIVNLKANSPSSSCGAVSLNATMPGPGNLVLFFSGNIPSNLTECGGAGTLFTITDQSGNSISTTIPVKVNMNNISGYPIDLTATPIVTSDDLTISATLCLQDSETDSICQSILGFTFINTAECPSVGYISGTNSISYSFNHSSGAKTYTVELYNNLGTILLQSQSQSVTDPVTVSGTFSGLTENTSYKIRVRILTTTRTTTCPFTVVTTLPGICPAPQTVTSILTID